jgi:uncharacterized integral membrane protein
MEDFERQPEELQPAPRRRVTQSPAAAAARANLGTLIVALIVVAAALIFVLQNRQRVSVSFLSVDITAPIWVLVVGYFVLGGVIVGGLMWLRRSRR